MHSKEWLTDLFSLVNLDAIEVDFEREISSYPRGTSFFMKEIYPDLDLASMLKAKEICLLKTGVNLNCLLVPGNNFYFSIGPFAIMDDNFLSQMTKTLAAGEFISSSEDLVYLRSVPHIVRRKVDALISSVKEGDDYAFREINVDAEIDFTSSYFRLVGSFEWSIRIEEQADSFSQKFLNEYLTGDGSNLEKLLGDYLITFMVVLDDDLPLLRQSILHELSLFESVSNSYSVNPAFRALVFCIREEILQAQLVRELVEAHAKMIHAIFSMKNSYIQDCDNPQILQVQKYIRDNYREQVNRDVLAEEAGLNPNYLSWLFHKEVGCSLSEYLQTVRIERSKVLLKYTNMTISEIARECGFNDANYFSRKFREATGARPLAFRKQSIQGALK